MTEQQDLELAMKNPQEWLANHKSNRTYHVWKQSIDVGMIIIFSVLILFLAYSHLINSEAVSALVGLMIGYVLSEFRTRVIK